jgi:hypothetical protein
MSSREHRGQQQLDHFILPDNHLMEFLKQLGFHDTEAFNELMFAIAGRLDGGWGSC